MKYEIFFRKQLALIEGRLRDILKMCEAKPLKVHRAMQYALFTGGKRFRPVLALAACEACGGRVKEALVPACAVELIHTYSLVHDDLPALDNDEMRRGKPTCHKKFDEATAILAGDGLLTLALGILATVKPPARAVKLLREIAAAAGVQGMIGGQVADLATQGKAQTIAEHDFISINKTGKLIRVSAVAGAIAAGASSGKVRVLCGYGEHLGLAFQVVDDILDVDGYCRVMPREQVVRKAASLINTARHQAKEFGRRGEKLLFLADFLASQIPK